MGIKIELNYEEEARIRYTARRMAESKLSISKYSQHPWPFLRDCVRTVDQAVQQVRDFPNAIVEPNPSCSCGGCTCYQHHIVNEWMRYRVLVIPKSRRMMLTWTMVACHYWMVRFHPGSTVAFVSRKQGATDSEGSAELVRRAKFIHDRLPDTFPRIETSYSWCRFQVFSDPPSEIIGIGQGANQLRQYTVTAIMADEMAFWEEAQDTYVAALPTIEGGGRFTGISSAHPGFFKRLVFDSVDNS